MRILTGFITVNMLVCHLKGFNMETYLSYDRNGQTMVNNEQTECEFPNQRLHDTISNIHKMFFKCGENNHLYFINVCIQDTRNV